MPREWNARSYDSLPLPHQHWGTRVLEQVTLTGAEHVPDAGAGTGRDTAALLERLPRGRVTAVDASDRMLEVLRGKDQRPSSGLLQARPDPAPPPAIPRGRLHQHRDLPLDRRSRGPLRQHCRCHAPPADSSSPSAEVPAMWRGSTLR
ncbi:class I SAM-dependent methyltransferase [Janibacter limosus]|uniref:class I SAM-dependent methyltransferase n=1 Tax=Janibacter limosus TaxID=53458 RepID=UPI0035D8DDD7